MDKKKTGAAVVGGLALLALGGYAWWSFRDDSDPTPEPGPQPGPRPSPGDPYRCKLDGSTADPEQYPDPASVVVALRKLGYPINDIESSDGRMQIKAFQARARELGLDGMDGAPSSYIDGIVGGCTLSALATAEAWHGLDSWPSPQEPLG